MQTLRAFLLRHRAFAMVLVMAALCLKAAIPAGYMAGNGARILSVQICADATGQNLTRQVVVPTDGTMPAGQADHAKAEGACAWSTLAMASLSGADAALLALAVAFVLALGFAPVRAVLPRRTAHVWPPLRGPPALA